MLDRNSSNTSTDKGTQTAVFPREWRRTVISFRRIRNSEATAPSRAYYFREPLDDPRHVGRLLREEEEEAERGLAAPRARERLRLRGAVREALRAGRWPPSSPRGAAEREREPRPAREAEEDGAPPPPEGPREEERRRPRPMGEEPRSRPRDASPPATAAALFR